MYKRQVSGWKVDQDGFELGGAVIGLFRFDETEFTEETALMVTCLLYTSRCV